MKDERNTKRQFKNELVTSEGERKRVERRALRQRTLLEAINKVFRETLRCETDEEVASTCLAVAQELTGSQFGFIGEVNQAGLFDTIALSDPGWHACRMPRSDAVRMIKDMKIRGIWGTVLKDEQSLIVNHPDSHPNRVGTPQGHPSITSFLGVLLKYGGKTFGMIGLANKESGYDLADQQTVETLSVAFMEALMRKRMEEALKESEEKFRTLFENSRDAIFIADTVTGKIMDVNQAACDLMGMSKADLIGLHQSELHPPDKTDEYRRLFKEHVSSGKAITTDLYVRRADGELVPVDISASMVKMGDRVVIQGVFRNVTERKHMEEALRESEEKYRRIFETSKDVLYLTSREGKFIDINQAGVDL
ncbi:MAG TPA: PAS domain S-box protein, partial [Syntrophaceae bacterium]|nr:PAS domain S-box protein [Syntrophaceae bacterium]